MDLSHLMTEEVTVKALTGRDTSGDPTYGAAATVKCRVQRKTQTIRTAEGTFAESSTTLFSATAIPRYARAWLAGSDTANDGAALTVLSTKEDRTLAGAVILNVAFL